MSDQDEAWRPIETAPKPHRKAYHGPRFLVGRREGANGEGDAGNVGIGHFVRALLTGEFLLEVEGAFRVDLPPTHWMPLPAPPGSNLSEANAEDR